MLRRQLEKVGVECVEHNIWDEPAAAAVVRRFANGNETVPTVVIGDVGLVNPSGRQVAEHLEAEAPHLLPDGYEPPPPSRVERLVGKLLGS
jgi:glutaredoxin